MLICIHQGWQEMARDKRMARDRWQETDRAFKTGGFKDGFCTDCS